ncbi:hypothetical protein [Pelagerythrobacter rhizovicinus]|uniref:Uncharacterized protein n=1 Tax=Pelagerythrobacter rhizovicinus TaxID=2268576 RepID=A0A4Q2KJ70_9SPHN|nr:hypothetical protein [Pelagerythrobacter rhizovicinus]RXZ64240.1 hypothetical protein ETX26_10025 [Pelagerythrobacter rhizovicinus]
MMNSIFPFRFEIARKAWSHDVLLVFVATPALDPEAFATVIEREVEQNLVPDEVVLLVRDPAFYATQQALGEDSQNVATIARLAGRATVTLIGYDCAGAEARRTHVTGPASKRRVKLADFKRRAITSIFNARHGFVESTATYHFENPSGRHTERFIRLSNILARGAEIAFIGFCTLPYVASRATTAYLDTPSLYAVVAAINEQRSSFAGSVPILADNFSSYAGARDYRFTRLADSLVLISASSSGSLASHLIAEHGFAPAQVTHLLFLGTDRSGSNIVCDLRKDARQNEEGVATPPSVEGPDGCRMCRTGSHAIKLHGDQFEFAGPQQESLLIAKSDAPAGLGGLMERFAGGGLFTVGLGKSVGRQPRQFNVEPIALLAHTEFQQRLDYVSRRSLPASLRHVIAVDEASVPFAQKIADAVSPATVVVPRGDLETIPASTETAIAIAAVVIESGRSLLDISRDLRTIAPKAPLLYLAGFSKTTAEPRREALERTLVQTVNPYPYQMIEVERMTLPLSSEHNPWAEELRLLIDPDVERLIPFRIAPVVHARVARLRRTSQALDTDLFLANSGTRKLSLQPGFVFWPDGVPTRAHSQADVYFTVASVLQRLRANAHRTQKSALKSNWFQQTVLAPENFGRFNDDIIQASILRAAHPYEMNLVDAPTDSRELGRLIRRIILAAGTERGGAAAEFLLALATSRLRLRRTDLEVALSAEPSSVPMVEFLRKVCATRLL